MMTEAELAHDTVDRLTESAEGFCSALRANLLPGVSLELQLTSPDGSVQFFAVTDIEQYLAMMRYARECGSGDYMWKLVKDRRLIVAEHVFHV